MKSQKEQRRATKSNEKQQKATKSNRKQQRTSELEKPKQARKNQDEQRRAQKLQMETRLNQSAVQCLGGAIIDATYTDLYQNVAGKRETPKFPYLQTIRQSFKEAEK